MRLPVLLLSSCILIAPALGAPPVLAQEPAAEEQVEPAPADSEPPPPAPSPPKSRPGIEEIVIQAGESDAAADFNAGDSVAAFDASDLEALGAQSVEDLAAFTPNLEIVTAGATTPTFFIRGVGLNDFNANSSGAVALYQDDVPLNAPALQLGTLFDMEAVNILRGPQGTGPYRNATAGAIKLFSRRPTPEYQAYLNAQYGNFNFMDFEGAVQAPIFEDILTSRFSFRYTERDGYMDNRCGDAPPTEERLSEVGPWLVAHPALRHGANVQLASVIGLNRCRALIWERGVGRTSASGTSSCAVAVAMVSSGRLDPGEIRVEMPGGALLVDVDGELDVTLRGPVEEVFDGELSEALLATFERGS